MPLDDTTPTVGGPSDPDVQLPLPPAPGMLVALLAHEGYEPHDDHLLVRGEHRWLRINARHAWDLSVHPGIKVDKETVEKLSGLDVFVDRRQLVIGVERFELVPRDLDGATWAVLEPGLPPAGESA